MYLRMPQVQLPVFPAGVTFINESLACQSQDDQIIYLNGHLPVFSHAQNDLASFRFFTTQLIINGSATQGEIARAFQVPLVTVKRSVQRHRTRGAAAFFTPAPRREGGRLNATVLAVAQGLFTQGHTVPEVSRQTGVLASTLHKAIRADRLSGPVKKKSQPVRLRSGDRVGHHVERAQRERCAGPARLRHHADPGAGGGERGTVEGGAARVRAG